MKTKNMRKKALLASVAMLLVAVVAMGGATYAWFSTNATATASGMSFTTSAESTLQFARTGATQDSQWDTTYVLNHDTSGDTDDPVNPNKQLAASVLSPASSVDGEAFMAVTGVGNPNADNKDTVVKGITGATGTYKWYESFLVRSSKAGDKIYVSDISAGNSAISNAIRIAIKVGTTNTPKVFALANRTTWAIDDETNFTADENNPVTYGDLYKAPKTTAGGTEPDSASGVDVDGVVKTKQTLATKNTLSSCLNDTDALEANTATPIKVTVWLEGNDAACTNEMMNQAISNFTISFTTTAPQS